MYAYESVSHWDKEKNQSRAKCILIGRVNPETGEFSPTDGRNKKNPLVEPITKCAPVVAEISARLFYGTTYLLDAIADKLGIERNIKQVFPDLYKQIMSVAYYLIIEDCSPFFRFEK